jgi:hypothetical protein
VPGLDERQQELYRAVRWAIAGWAGLAACTLAWLLALPAGTAIIVGIASTGLCFSQIARHLWREAQITGPVVYVASRLPDTTPRAHSRPQHCAACGRAIAIEPLAYYPLRLRRPEVQVLCEQCAMWGVG